MSLRSLEFAAIESATGIVRNGLMSVASVTTVGLSLAILGSFVLLALGLNNAVQSEMSKFEIAVWLKGDISEIEATNLELEIRALPHVKSAQLISAEATWEKIKKDWRDKIQLGGVQPTSLTDHFRVTLSDPRYTAGTAESIRKISKVEEVIEGRQIVEQVVRFADFVRLIGWCTAGVLFLIAAFIISNTIRLTVYARRREIKIMQLVGATNWFIRLPYLFEGTVLGALGGGAACLLVFGGGRYLGDVVAKIMPLLAQFSSGLDPMRFYGSLVGAGCFIGAMGSLISIRRFLKV
jgi:cell division transport system permease protein